MTGMGHPLYRVGQKEVLHIIVLFFENQTMDECRKQVILGINKTI
jgi:hypothetical protein